MKNPFSHILAAALSMRHGLMKYAMSEGKPTRTHGTSTTGQLGCHGNCTRAERIFRATGNRTAHLQEWWERDGYQSRTYALVDRHPSMMGVALSQPFHPYHAEAVEAMKLGLFKPDTIIYRRGSTI